MIKPLREDASTEDIIITINKMAQEVNGIQLRCYMLFEQIMKSADSFIREGKIVADAAEKQWREEMEARLAADPSSGASPDTPASAPD